MALLQGGCFDQLSFVLFPIDKDRATVLFLELDVFPYRVLVLSFHCHSRRFAIIDFITNSSIVLELRQLGAFPILI